LAVDLDDLGRYEAGAVQVMRGEAVVNEHVLAMRWDEAVSESKLLSSEHFSPHLGQQMAADKPGPIRPFDAVVWSLGHTPGEK
jgi:hypothetical protein